MNENKKYSNCALIDNDFFLCFSSMQKIDGIVLFKKIFDNMKLQPYVHEYVFKYEMFNNEKAKSLVNEGFLRELKWLDIFGIGGYPEQNAVYRKAIMNTYENLTGKKLRIPKDCDFLNYHCAGKSLGEINSIYTAKEKQIPFFCSNDHDSIEVRNYLCKVGFKVEIITVNDLLEVDFLSADEKKYLHAALVN